MAQEDALHRGDFGTVLEHSNMFTNHEGRIKRLEEDKEIQWEAINFMRDRLPMWATAVATLGGGIIGSLITAIYFILNYFKV